MVKKLALITGASAGIGSAFARLYARRGWDVALAARREDRLEALAAEIRAEHACEALVFPGDLSDPATPEALLAGIAKEGRSVAALINNAGYGTFADFAGVSVEEQRRFIQVMIAAPTELVSRVLPAMREARFGRIIEVASLAGILPGSPGTALYGAAKAWLIRFAQSLHLELRGSGVHITALCPGLTRSEFHSVAGMTSLTDRTPGFLWQGAEEVALCGYQAVEAGRVRAVPGAQNKAVTALARLLPETAAMNLLASQVERYRRD
ncbi:MAG: SDR family NAD(P)-dependent oxidoreductase [Caulobacteraceae bacterium]